MCGDKPWTQADRKTVEASYVAETRISRWTY